MHKVRKYFIFSLDTTKQDALFQEALGTTSFPEEQQKSLIKGVLAWFPHILVRVTSHHCYRLPRLTLAFGYFAYLLPPNRM